MLSALIPTEHSYPAVPLAGQLAHQRFVHSGPLVLGAAPLKFPTPTMDRDRTVSRRSEPSSRAALIGEQPNPWDVLPPQDATSRHRGTKSLSPTFVSARLVGLAVKLPYAFALYGWFPFSLREPLGASVTL